MRKKKLLGASFPTVQTATLQSHFTILANPGPFTTPNKQYILHYISPDHLCTTPCHARYTPQHLTQRPVNATLQRYIAPSRCLRLQTPTLYNRPLATTLISRPATPHLRKRQASIFSRCGSARFLVVFVMFLFLFLLSYA